MKPKIFIILIIFFLVGCTKNLFEGKADKNTKEAKQVEEKISMSDGDFKKVLENNQAAINDIKSDAEDSDLDGLTNRKEREIGTDPNNPDTDGDKISDGDELKQGTNPLISDSDQDGDGLSDAKESEISTDKNKKDTDGDCIDDFTEYVNYYQKGYKENNLFNPIIFDDFSDCDGDGISYANEIKNGTDQNKIDTDDDGIPDNFETNTGIYLNEKNTGSDPNIPDTDGDGAKDGEELKNNTSPVDRDNDGLDDLKEAEYKTDPANPDSDGDGISDGLEIKLGMNPLLDEASIDRDKDGLTNDVEIAKGTNPDNPDSDNDGFNDGWEVSQGLNPLKDDRSLDTDRDGLSNYDEIIIYKTNPNKIDTDGDGLSDDEEIKGLLTKTGRAFIPTKPNMKDTDEDGFFDSDEVNQGTDPLNPNSFSKQIVKEKVEIKTDFGNTVIDIKFLKDEIKPDEVVSLDLTHTTNSINFFVGTVANEQYLKAIAEGNKTEEEALAIKAAVKKQVEKAMIQAVKKTAEANGQTLTKDDQNNLIMVNLGYVEKPAQAGSLTSGQKDTLGVTAVAHMGDGNVDMLNVLNVASTTKKGAKADELLSDALPSKSKENSAEIGNAINNLTIIPAEERTKEQKETLGIAAASHVANELYNGARDEELTAKTNNVTIYDPNLVSVDLAAKVQQDYDLSQNAFSGVNDKWSEEIGKSKTKVETFQAMDADGTKNEADGMITQSEAKTFLQHSNEDAVKGDRLTNEEKITIEAKDADLKAKGQEGLLPDEWQYKYIPSNQVPVIP